MHIDGLALHFLVHELQNSLLGGRIEKIQQPTADSLVISLRQHTQTLHLLVSANPRQACLYFTTQYAGNMASPLPFCMLLRHQIENGRLTAIEQCGLDRIIRLTIDVKGEQGRLVTKVILIELMGKHSNIILTEDDVILDAIRHVPLPRSRVREIMPGKAYTPPPTTQGVNLLQTPASELISLVRQSSLPLVKALIANSEGLGPYTAGEIVWRAGLTPDQPATQLTDTQAARLAEATWEVMQPLINGTVTPTVTVAAGSAAAVITPFPPGHLAAQAQHTFTTMNEALCWAATLHPIFEEQEKTSLQKMVEREYDKLARKIELLRQDMQAADNADSYRIAGDILMTFHSSVVKGQTTVTLPNIYQPGQKITLALDPTLTGIENAQKYYHRYNKLKRSAAIVTQQLMTAQEELAYLDSVLQSLEQAESAAELAQIRQELMQMRYIKNKQGRHSQLLKIKPLTIISPEGCEIIIGKNNQQNDFITFKIAAPEDLWFHVKNFPGSHVVVKCGTKEPGEKTLLAAAHLAVWFSKARQSSNVTVEYTRRKYVKKPAGAKPGFVIYERQRAITITPDPNLVQELLQRKKD